MHIFYDHIILIHEVYSEVESLPLGSEEKREMVEMIEETIHHKIVHRILDHLDEEHHEVFIERFHESPHDKELLKYLKEYIPDVESKIKDAADEVKYDLLKTIRKEL